MWQKILWWFRSKLTNLYYQILNEIERLKRFLKISNVDISKVKGEDNLQQAMRLYTQSNNLAVTVEDMQRAQSSWSKLSWLFHYLFGTRSSKVKYRTVKNNLIQAIKEVRYEQRETLKLIVHYTDLDVKRYLRYLPEESPLRHFYEGYLKYIKGIDEDDAVNQLTALAESKENQALILKAVEGNYPAMYHNLQKLTRGLYYLRMNAVFHSDIEDPQDEALKVFEELSEKEFTPAYLHYAELLSKSGHVDDAFDYYIKAAKDGSVVAMRRLAFMLYDFYNAEFKNTKHEQLPAKLFETNSRRLVSSLVAQAALYYDDHITDYTYQKIHEIFDMQKGKVFSSKQSSVCRDLLYGELYYEQLKIIRNRKKADFEYEHSSLDSRVSNLVNKMFSGVFSIQKSFFSVSSNAKKTKSDKNTTKKASSRRHSFFKFRRNGKKKVVSEDSVKVTATKSI